MPRYNRAHMAGGSDNLEPPQMVAVTAGHQEQLKQSHIMVNSNYFPIDPNQSFDSSSILVEDRVYLCDTTPLATQPISWSINPQFNIFKSLSESRFVFQVSLSGQQVSTGGIGGVGVEWIYYPKAFFSSLFVQDFTYNLNNVNCSDVHSSTCQYSHFVKTILFDANLRSPTATVVSVTNLVNLVGVSPIPYLRYGLGCDDARTIPEGIISTDWINGICSGNSTHGAFLTSVDGTFNNQNFTNNGSAIEITYRPRDGIFLTPKLICPGVVENIIMRLNDVNNIFQCSNSSIYRTGSPATVPPYTGNPGVSFYNWIDQVLTPGVTMNILSAKYFQRQYTPTQSCLRSYQSLISMQPVYIPVVTANSFLVSVPANQTSVSLQNVLAGRIPNTVVIALLNQNPSVSSPINNLSTGPNHQFKTYSPLPGLDTPFINKQCLQTVRLQVNGRVYPHLYSINCAQGSTQDTSQLYEMYKQACLVRDLHGRNDGSSNINMNQQYKMDNPILSFGEFRANLTYFVYNIRRNNTLENASGDKEVGSIDLVASIDTTSLNPLVGNSQLLVVGISSDSLASFSDGGSTTSFVY